MQHRLNNCINWLFTAMALFFVSWLIVKYPLNNETPIRDAAAAFFALPIVAGLYLTMFVAVGVGSYCLYTAILALFSKAPDFLPEDTAEEEEQDDNN